MKTYLRVLTIAILAVCFGFTHVPECAANGFANAVSDATAPLAVAGVAAAFFSSKEHGKQYAARTADAILISYGIVELLKPSLKVNDEPAFRHSFPSGHSAIAFATAQSLARIHPRQKWFYYAGAALVGWSRVEKGAHQWGDVAGGAAVGIGIGNWSIGSGNGLLLGRIYRF